MTKQYQLLEDRFDLVKGTIVQEVNVHDYGLARDDTNLSGEEHLSVSPTGGYPFITCPIRLLEELQ